MKNYPILPQQPAAATAVEATGMPEADSGDVGVFQAILAMGTPTSGLPHGQRELGSAMAQLAALADRHQLKKHKVETGMLRAARAGDPVQMYKLNKQYSELMLEHALAMKVVGKTTAAVESLGRLQ